MSKLIVKSNEIIDAYDHALYFHAFTQTNGVMELGQKLEMIMNTANLCTIEDGIVYIQGRPYIIYPNAVEQLEIESGSQSMERYDYIVAEFDRSTEDTTLKVITGEPSKANAQIPLLTQENTLVSGAIYQEPLYLLHITGINVEEIIDMREYIPSLGDAKYGQYWLTSVPGYSVWGTYDDWVAFGKPIPPDSFDINSLSTVKATTMEEENTVMKENKEKLEFEEVENG